MTTRPASAELSQPTIQTVQWTVRWTVRITLTIAVVVVTLWGLNRAGWLDLPGALTVSSRGSAYVPFQDADGGLRSGGVSLLLVLVAWWALRSPPDESRALGSSSRSIATASIIAAVACGLVWWYLSRWPHAFPSNARMHWVDTLDRSGTLQFSYWLTHASHRVFYEYPALLTGLCGAVAGGAQAAALRMLGIRSWLAVLAACLLLLGPQMLSFANMSEDVPVVAAVMGLALVGLVGQRGWVFGIACGLLVLTRPQLGLLFVAGLLARLIELACTTSSRRALLRMATDSFCWTSLLTWFAVLAPPYLWMYGHGVGLVGNEIDMLMYAPITIDAFTIHPWSGAFALHALWIMPAGLIAGAVVSCVTTFKASRWPRGTCVALTCLIFIVANTVLYERVAMFYFNWRYLAYMMPVLSLSAFVSVAWCQRRSTRVAIVLGLFMALSPLAGSGNGLAMAHKAQSSTLAQLWPQRMAFREAIGDATIHFIINGRTSKMDRNQMCYLLRMTFDRVQPYAESEQPTLVLVTRDDADDLIETGWQVRMQTEDLMLLGQPTP